MINVMERTLVATDRCDACSAAARVIIALSNGELMFCGHHSKQHKEKLLTQSVSVYDPDNYLS